MLSSRKIRISHLCLLERNFGVQLLGMQTVGVQETWRRLARGEREREAGKGQSLQIIRQRLFFILKVEGTLLHIFNWE